MTTSTGVQYNFIYDTTAGIPAVLMEKAGTAAPTLYIRTPDGRLIASVTAGASPSLERYYHFDGLGSTLALTDSTGAMTDHYEYDGWGQVMDHMGSSTQPYEFVGQLGYYAHNQDMQFSVYFRALQLGVRYYVPGIGRFTQRDRIPQISLSDYLYAAARVTGSTDPTGLAPVMVIPVYPLILPVRHETPIGCLRNAMDEAERIHYFGERDDKLAHCFFACRAARCFGILRFCPLFPITEDVIGRVIERYWSNNDREDANVQTIGIAAAYSNHSCRDACRATITHLRNRTGRYKPE